MVCFGPAPGPAAGDRPGAGLDNAWLTSGHFRTGILNAPATAAVLARWIAAGEPPAEPATWAASRFASRAGGSR